MKTNTENFSHSSLVDPLHRRSGICHRDVECAVVLARGLAPIKPVQDRTRERALRSRVPLLPIPSPRSLLPNP